MHGNTNSVGLSRPTNFVTGSQIIRKGALRCSVHYRNFCNTKLHTYRPAFIICASLYFVLESVHILHMIYTCVKFQKKKKKKKKGNSTIDDCLRLQLFHQLQRTPAYSSIESRLLGFSSRLPRVRAF